MGDTVEMTINEQPVRLRLAPDAVSVPTLNADAAQRIGLKPSMIGFIYVIGPEKIGFRTDNVRYRAGTASFKRRTAFSDRQLTQGADDIAGPETFPFARTTFIMREARPGDRPITLPLDREMGRSQTGVRIAVGGRPIRSLSLERPLMLGELEIRNLAVRVSDMGNSRGIAEGPAPEGDPSEIIVSGDSKRKVPSQRLYIGMDTIGHCVSIIYDFAAGTVTLMCPDQPSLPNP